MARRSRESVVRLTLVLGAVLFACLTTEAAFRLVGWRQGIDYRLYLKELTNSDRLPAGLFRTDRRLGRGILAPNAEVLAVTSDFSVVYRTNGEGLRDREHSYERPPAVLRVLALGDSFTFGEGVPYGERFTDIAENALDGVEIINAGVPGWGIENELVYLELEGVRYRPDWVVVFINFVDTIRPVSRTDRDGVDPATVTDSPWLDAGPPTGQRDATWYIPADDPFFARRSFLVRESYALSYLTFRVTLARRRGPLERDDARVWAEASGAVPAHVTSAAPRTLLALRKLADTAEAAGARLMVVNIDPATSLDYVADADPRIVYDDLTPSLIDAARHRLLSFKYDRHFNPGTHALIGRQLVEILRPLVEAHRRHGS